ncbi:uncharacterized protein DUF1488 [Paraburkholderia eburnea]|uniref:Uncharacterized protein DUF1488 n=1 Tax=Paraburkholderia eburnea TaxID=1189126 RepID=A0A2S4MIF3_9BURK|nr:DUF1488 family protein [Paraburkholderia eburnea]POR54533.1 uncharacterized protein DUF1488 [Paraburkholderia eburnea]PRZ19748.1 uncharacterized protein DUF1488 [Paraburkholderia eburnea]
MAYIPTPGTARHAADDGVRFSLTIDGAAQQYWISHEALENHFGDENGRLDGLLAAFDRNQERIYEVAAAKLGAAPVGGNGGRISLSSNDFN